MCPSTVTLCAAIVLFHGVSCHLFPEAILDPLTSVDHPKSYKRQTVTELRQCISEKFNAAFMGNASQFVSDCRWVTTREFDLDPYNIDVTALQSYINEIYPILCNAECGNVILDVYDEWLFGYPTLWYQKIYSWFMWHQRQWRKMLQNVW